MSPICCSPWTRTSSRTLLVKEVVSVSIILSWLVYLFSRNAFPRSSLWTSLSRRTHLPLKEMAGNFRIQVPPTFYWCSPSVRSLHPHQERRVSQQDHRDLGPPGKHRCSQTSRPPDPEGFLQGWWSHLWPWLTHASRSLSSRFSRKPLITLDTTGKETKDQKIKEVDPKNKGEP